LLTKIRLKNTSTITVRDEEGLKKTREKWGNKDSFILQGEDLKIINKETKWQRGEWMQGFGDGQLHKRQRLIIKEQRFYDEEGML
jgi:hypothetical protein